MKALSFTRIWLKLSVASGVSSQCTLYYINVCPSGHSITAFKPSGRLVWRSFSAISAFHIYRALILLSFSIAAKRWRVIALTNNYTKAEEALSHPDEGSARLPRHDFDVNRERAFLGWTEGANPARLRALFDDFCDSSTFGMRFVMQSCPPAVLH